MSLSITHSTEQKTCSLSERLKYIAKDDNSYRNYVDKAIKSENLKFNIALVISHIILNLEFIERSPEVFCEVIAKYNQEYETSLTFQDFERADLIRVISNQVLMPEVVRHFVWQVGHYEKEKKAVEIPSDNRDLILCLVKYYKQYFENARLTISLEKLNEIIRHFGSTALSISYFEKNEIVRYDPKGHFYWAGGEYKRHLRNEIASTLWLLVTESQATNIEFNRYIKLILGAGIWVDDLAGYLSQVDTSKICELAVNYLNSEQDLLKSDKEFTKIWLDANAYQHVNFHTPIPIVEFNYDSTYAFIESVNYHKWRFRDAFDYQSTRSFCHSLLRMVITNDTKHPRQFENTLLIIKDTTRPFLLWTLYNDIQREFPFVIPHLLNDLELIPIALRLVDKIHINKDILSQHLNNDDQIKESQGVKNQVWMEMFEFILERLASDYTGFKENGHVIAKIFIEVAENVFRINTSNISSLHSHRMLKTRYDEALDRLRNLRVVNKNVFPPPLVNTRLMFFLLPDVLTYFEERISTPKIPHIEFRNLEIGLIDVCIEFLRLSNTPLIHKEISEDQKSRIQESRTNLIKALQLRLIQFYGDTEVNVKVYTSAGTEKRYIRRGIDQFGFEIVDWGYLFLNFEKHNLLDDFQGKFKNSLIFNVAKDKYDETNQDQLAKIGMYLKSLMLAFYSLNQKQKLYKIDVLPVEETIKKLEGWIKELSLKYSLDDIPNSRIDVFDERFSIEGYDEYHQPLISLLFRSVNYFERATQKVFFEDLLAENFDTGRLLTALNLLDSRELRDLISSNCTLDKTIQFIDNASTITELQNAMIEAVNSKDNWSLAQPLLEKVEEHYKKIQHFNENVINVIYEVKLLLAFKEKNLAKLSAIPIPESDYDKSRSNQNKGNRKSYLIALHQLYHEYNYDDAILKLESLHSREVMKIEYAFHLLRAKTLKAISKDESPPHDALVRWQEFVVSLKDDSEKLLADFDESLELNNIHYHIADNSFSLFEQAISKLTSRFLFDEEILVKVFDYYLTCHLDDLALKYIKDAEQYFSELGIVLPEKLRTAIESGEKTEIIKVKASLNKLLGFKPTTVIAAIPSVHNGETDLNTFILIELVQGLKALLDKKSSIRTLAEENELNDMLQVSIKPRIALWGWSIPDQSRSGRSPNGKDAGELDFVIESASKKIALIEALVLKGKDKTKTQKHVLKVFDYVTYLQRYYIVVYFKGSAANFEHSWSEYKHDVLEVSFPPSVELNLEKGFQEISNNQEDVRQIKISKTSHNNNVELFHVMVNLSL